MIPLKVMVVEESVHPLHRMDDVAPTALFATAVGAECKVSEDGLPAEPPEGVGEPADETVKTSPVGIGVSTELLLGDSGVWKDCVTGTVVGESKEPVCEDAGVV